MRIRELAAVLLVAGIAIATSQGRALAKDGSPGSDGLPGASEKHPWIIFPGDPRVDTLSFSIPDIAAAGCREFEDDNWVMFVNDPARGLIVTRWKQIHHPLIWLFAGKMMARVTVRLQAIGPRGTRVVFLGELASHHSLVRNPILSAARRAYAKAFSNWRRNVVKDLTSRHANK